MSQVYISGMGLVSSVGVNLAQAMQNLYALPPPILRSVKGLEQSFPFHAIPRTTQQTASTWYERCENLIKQALLETGCPTKTATMFLASSSSYVGALEAGEIPPENIPAFLNQLAKSLNWQGPIHWISTACTSALNAILAAKNALLSNAIEDAVIIGLEVENQLTLAGFAGMRLLSHQGARPFAADRNGLVLGEAVAALHLSKQKSRWRIAGGAHVIDSNQASGASLTAYQTMLDITMANAGFDKTNIDLIKVQAAGSLPNDEIEAQAITGYFSSPPHLITLKTMIGHTLGASGAAEIALLLKLLEQEKWPAQIQDVDPNLQVSLAQTAPQPAKHILACILGFGGSHSCIAIEDTLA
jgi:3-oxoacyl-[acyl-carrier-protein] synthase I